MNNTGSYDFTHTSERSNKTAELRQRVYNWKDDTCMFDTIVKLLCQIVLIECDEYEKETT